MVKVSTHYLDNGVQWIAAEDPKASEFRLIITSRNGEEREWRKHQRGATHLLEHLMFRGKDLESSKEVFYSMENAGILNNGVTTRHSCDLFWYGPTRSRDLTFERAHHSLTFDHSSLTREEKQVFGAECLEKEREIVENELLMRMSEDMWVQLEEVVTKEVYNGSPYGQTYNDQLKTLEGITAEQLFSLRGRLFTPSNLTVITLSAMDEGRLSRQVERTFGPLHETENPYTPLKYTLPQRRATRKDFVHAGATTSFVRQTMRCGPATPEDLATLYVLNEVLGVNETSVLYLALRVVAAQTYRPKTDMILSRPEMLMSTYYPCKEKHIESNIGIVNSYLEQLATKRLARSDFDRYQLLAVNAFNRDIVGNDEELGDWLGDAAALGLHGRNGRNGGPRVLTPKDMVREIRATTPEMLKCFVRAAYPGMVTAVFHPGEAASRVTKYEP